MKVPAKLVKEFHGDKTAASKEWTAIVMRKGFDTQAEIAYKKYTGKAYPMKGWVVARMMYDKGTRMQPFTFYPRRTSGVPPYHAATKAGAKAQLKRAEKIFGKSYKLKVVKLTPKVYLDRY